MIKSYWVINLFNGIGKVVKKVVAKELFSYCKDYLKLYSGKMG